MQKKLLIFIIFLSLTILNFAIARPSNDLNKSLIKINETKVVDGYEDVNPLAVVKEPKKYLNKKIRIKATFDKFSVVGLEYKPAFRSSEDYILFLIRKSETKGHIIPLSEMKLFITRKEAEKYIDLESGDEIVFTGKVFSTALGDPWIDVDSLTILTKKPKKADEKADKPKSETSGEEKSNTEEPKKENNSEQKK